MEKVVMDILLSTWGLYFPIRCYSPINVLCEAETVVSPPIAD